MARAPVLTFLDPGSARTGYCFGDGTRLPRAGAWTFAQTGDNYGRVLRQLADALEAHIEAHRPDEVCYEEPIVIFNQPYRDASGMTRYRNDNLATLRKTIPLGPRIEEVCDRHDIPCHETSIASVKKELSGLRTASKDEMVAAAEKLGVMLPEGPARKDAADAVGGWLLLLRLRNRVCSERFDRALHGARPFQLL